MNDPKLKQLIHMAAGQISMQWEPLPHGIFQSDEVIEICADLIKDIEDRHVQAFREAYDKGYQDATFQAIKVLERQYERTISSK